MLIKADIIMACKKILVSLAILLFSPLVSATDMHSPFTGIDIVQTNQNYKERHGKNVYKKNIVDYSIFAGFKFNNHFGVEAGFEWQPKKNKTVTATSQETIEGEINDDPADIGNYDITNITNITSKNSIKGSHPYLGVFGEYKLHAFRFQAMLGASVSTVKIRQNFLSVVGSDADVPDVVTGGVDTGSKTRIVPMVKLSSIYDVNDHFGVRLSVRYHNLGSVKIKIDQDRGGIRKVELRDTLGLGLGIVYWF